MNELAKKAKQALKKRFGATEGGIITAQAPGRVNLIGGHTDYNDGFVLPVAIDREIVIAAIPRADKQVRAYSLDFSAEENFNLTDISYNKKTTWINYLQGVAKFLQKAGYSLQGMDLVLTGNIPQGAGLSSSAALEVVTALTFQLVNDFGLDRVELAKICRQAENEFVGVSCGIMDQFISVLGQRDQALFLDCRSHDYKLVPIEDQNIKIVVSNTKVEHSLVDSAYNQRLKECSEGVKLFNQFLTKEVTALRDITVKEFKEYQQKLPETIRKRVKHVVMENKRVEKTVKALVAGNLEQAGKLMVEAHKSLRDFYEVSCKELDLLVDIALDIEGVYGARMTGAGFGGCTVSLVKEKSVPKFKQQIYQNYQTKTGIEPEIYICNIETGAEEIKT